MRIEDLPMADRLWILGILVIFIAKIYSIAAPEGYPVLHGSYWFYIAIWAAIVLVVRAVVGNRPPRDSN